MAAEMFPASRFSYTLDLSAKLQLLEIIVDVFFVPLCDAQPAESPFGPPHFWKRPPRCKTAPIQGGRLRRFVGCNTTSVTLCASGLRSLGLFVQISTWSFHKI